ncbi:hypothetical protein B0H12DRAFT_1106827 [Mycena haematopus]|nr:hypothetical protein B0H12DRAFT_1106827 [Mycena haematopus]
MGPAASLTLHAYDTFLNLDLEYRYIWRRKWSLIKCLYIWSRYGTFLEIILDVLRRVDMNLNLDPSTCTTLLKVLSIYSGSGFGIVEVILWFGPMRYMEGPKNTGIFEIMWLGGGCFSFLEPIFRDNSTLVEPSSPNISCDLDNSNNILFACFVSFVGETVIAGPALKSMRLLTSFYRDGILFYLVMLLSLVLVVVLRSDAPVNTHPLRVIHAILACQLVVHVRVVASEDESKSAATKTPIVFANFPMGSGRGVDSIV